MDQDNDTPRPGWLGPWLKGFPALQPPLPLADVAQRGWALHDMPVPLAVVRQQALAHNIAWMQNFASERGVHLAPHGKTTMSPQLFRRQLDAGAWGLTFANVHQLRLGLAAGARRALIANQLVSAAELAELLDLRRRHVGLELAFFVDSQAQLDLIAAHWAQLGRGEARLDVLVELGTSRCGVREHAPALALARALKTHPALRLRGIGFYEGLQIKGETEPDVALMQQWQARLQALLDAIDTEGLLDADAQPLWLSGGGSAAFDLVAPVLAAGPKRLGLLRSGCYVCHDHEHYGRYMKTMDARMDTPLSAPSLQPALEVWTQVLSCPEPGLALLNAGRRDLSFDAGWPLPVWHLLGAERTAAPTGWRVTGLNDQHAYLRWDPTECDGPSVGERIALGRLTPAPPSTNGPGWRSSMKTTASSTPSRPSFHEAPPLAEPVRLPLSTLMPATAAAPSRFLHVGTYAPLGQGLYSFAIAADGSLKPLGVTTNANSPSWLTAHGQHVYAAEEGGDHVAVYTQDGAGRLELLQRLPSGGRSPAHLSVSEGHAWVAHYGDASFAALPLQADGRLGAAQSWPACSGPDCSPGPQHAVKRPPGSQANSGHDAPHAHMIQASPDGRWLLGTDLGRDRLLVWPLAPGAPTTAALDLALSPGSGPRHFAFHPQNARLVYVLQEESSTLSTVELTPEGPRLLDEISVLPGGFAGTNYASDLIVAPGGRHLYALNRLHESLAVIALAAPRSPRLLDHHWVHGSYPRSACRAGNHLYVCNQRSDQLSHFDLSRPERPRFSRQQTAVPSPAGACAL